VELQGAKKIKDDFVSKISDSVKERYKTGKVIDIKEYREMKVNSYESKLLEPLLSNESFIDKVENAFKNSNIGTTFRFRLPTTYTDFLTGDGIAGLLQRLKMLAYPLKSIEDACEEVCQYCSRTENGPVNTNPNNLCEGGFEGECAIAYESYVENYNEEMGIYEQLEL